MRLIFADRTAPGITREPLGDGFRYISARGRPLVSAQALKRISGLVIPPAWTNVWISPNAAAHIQATGVDAKGRLQYVYHPHFRQAQEAAKFSRLVKFAQALPKLREAVARDMALTGIPRERALATLVYLLEMTLIRIGNDAYARANESFGLSTLAPASCRRRGIDADLRVHRQEREEVAGDDPRPPRRRRHARLSGVAGPEAVPVSRRGGPVVIPSLPPTSTPICETHPGRRISAKDFRTWSGTLICAVALAKEPPAPSAAPAEAADRRGDARGRRGRSATPRPFAVRATSIPAVLESRTARANCYRHMSLAARRERAPAAEAARAGAAASVAPGGARRPGESRRDRRARRKRGGGNSRLRPKSPQPLA